MEEDWDSLDWLQAASDLIIKKKVEGLALSSVEQLVYEIWLLDVQACNGGLSQYFCNCGLQQWEKCVAAGTAAGLANFDEFAQRVERVISGKRDPYKAIIKAGRPAESLYYEYQSKIIRELRAFASPKL